MDERILFDRFHEALDVEPRPGAFERMRFELLNQPVALRRRPAFRMRFSKMGLRIAAAVVTAALVIAVVAALIATHHSPTGSVPAGQDKNVTAYRALIQWDYTRMNASTSSSCNSVQDTTCPAAAARVVTALQQWVDDLAAFHTPSSYAVLDGELRGHLKGAIADLDAAVAYQKEANSAGFDLAMNAAAYERAWVDPASFAIEGTYSKVAGSFRDAISLAKQSLDACVKGTPAPGDLGCSQLTAGHPCVGTGAMVCAGYVQNAATQLESFLVALVQNPPPGNLAARDEQLQKDIGAADTAVLVIVDGLVTGNDGKVASGAASYTTAVVNAQTEASAISTS